MSELIGGDEGWFGNSLWQDHFLAKSGGLDWPLKDQQIVPIPIVILDDGRVAFQSDDGQICLLDGLQGVEEGEDVLLPLPPCLDDPAGELPALSDATIKSMLVSNDLDAELLLVESVMPDLTDKSIPITIDGNMPDLTVCKDMPSLSSKNMPSLSSKNMSDLMIKDLPTLTSTNLQEFIRKELPTLTEKTMPDFDAKTVSELVNKDIDELMPHSPIDDELKALVSFRCQFCSFSSADVPSLMLHSKTEHDQPDVMSEDHSADSTPPSPYSQQPVNLTDEESENPMLTNVVDQFVYLCSECSEAFPSVDDCRNHMIQDHKMMVFDDMEKEDSGDNEEVASIEAEPAVAPVPLPPPPPAPTVPIKLPVKNPPKPRDYDPDFEAKPHKCREAFCVYKFRTLSHLDFHVQCHTQDEGWRFSCPECSDYFNRWSQCSIHLWKEHKIDIDLYTCNVCNEYKTTTRKKLESHAKIHSEERGYQCSECGKGFKQRTQLINHQASVHNKDKSKGPKWYMEQKCEICLKTYADSKCLKKHMQAVHSKLKPYKCQICGHMSARKAMLQAHVRQHTGEKPFACELCPFRTGDHNSLRRHVMRHTGKRPYQCPHCPYSSIQSSSFKSHLQTKHPGQSGAYTCTQCYFATVSHEAYRKHLSDHELNLIPPSGAEVFPENVAAADLVYRSFGASHYDMTGSSTSRDGLKQTIHISIPPHDRDSVATDDEDTQPCFLHDTGGITIPAEPEADSQLMCYD